MSAGYIIQGQCISAATAQGVLISHMLPGSVQVGADSFTWWFYASGAEIGKMTFKNNAYFQNESFAVPFGPSCNTVDTFNDGFLLGWGVVAAMVAAWAITVLRRAL